uniref:Dmx like 1 n=1 Tax=Xiphophorus couchianus TaxID=32473 RepID=A0A3B5LTZ7_9TELE
MYACNKNVDLAIQHVRQRPPGSSLSQTKSALISYGSLGKAAPSSSLRLSIFTPNVLMISKHDDGSLNQWAVSFAEDSAFSTVLSVSHKSRYCGHRFHLNDLACHSLLPLLLTTSHHNALRTPEADSILALAEAYSTGVPSFSHGSRPSRVSLGGVSQDPNAIYSELILWRVDPVGPLSLSGGVSELARINSLHASAFANVAWLPTLIPSSCLMYCNSPSACFVASDGQSLRLYQAVIEAKKLLSELSNPEISKYVGEVFNIISQQSTAKPGCIIELDAITDFHFFLVVVELTPTGRSLLHMWHLHLVACPVTIEATIQKEINAVSPITGSQFIFDIPSSPVQKSKPCTSNLQSACRLSLTTHMLCSQEMALPQGVEVISVTPSAISTFQCESTGGSQWILEQTIALESTDPTTFSSTSNGPANIPNNTDFSTLNGNCPGSANRSQVHLDWVSQEDGSHVLTVGIGTKIYMYGRLSGKPPDLGLSSETNRDQSLSRLVLLRSVNLVSSVEGSLPIPVSLSWVRDGILVVGMDCEMHVYSQWQPPVPPKPSVTVVQDADISEKRVRSRTISVGGSTARDQKIFNKSESSSPDYTEISSVPPLPLYALLAADEVIDLSQYSPTYFGPEHAQVLSSHLLHSSLPGLTRMEQMSLMALADTIATTSTDLKDNQGETLDECGLKFLLAVRLHTFLLTSLPPVHRAQLLRQLSTCQYAWAFHSEAEEELLNMLPALQKGEPTWAELRAMGVGWWLRSTNKLRRCIEKVAKASFQRNNDPLDAAIFYLAMKKKAVVWGLYSQKNTKMTEFFHNNFSEDRWRKAALKNAFSLLGKQRFQHSAAFFLLAGSLKDAVEVCLEKMQDLQLALVISRLYESEFETSSTYKKILQRHVLASNPEVFNFYIYLRTHPLLLRRHFSSSDKAKVALTTEVRRADTISLDERRLFFTTAYAHLHTGCPMLALEVLSKMPKVHKHSKWSPPGLNGYQSDGNSNSRSDSVLSFDWSQPSMTLPAEHLELKWDSDKDEEDEDEEIFLAHLKFTACLKIMSNELRTLSTGYELDGGKLRYQLCQWLEREQDDSLKSVVAVDSQPTSIPLLTACTVSVKTVVANPIVYLTNLTHDILHTINALDSPPHPDVVNNEIYVMHTLAASLSACIYQCLCDGHKYHVNHFTGTVYQSVLLSQKQAVKTVSLGEAVQPNTSPAQWPIPSLIRLLSSAGEETQPGLAVLLCEILTAVFLSLFVHGMATHSSNELFRIVAHPLNCKLWMTVFGGGARVPSPSGLDRKPRRFRILSSRSGSREESGIDREGPSSPKIVVEQEATSIFKEDFVPPDLSIWDYFIAKPLSQNRVEYDSEESQDSQDEDDEDLEFEDVFEPNLPAKEHSNHNSYWCLMRLAMVQLVLVNLKSFYPMAGYDLL